MELDKLVTDVESGSLSVIDKSGLTRALKRLQRFVGNSSLKDSIAMQARYLIRQISQGRDLSNMINFALYGSPGCGKTTIAKLVAAIITRTGALMDRVKLHRRRLTTKGVNPSSTNGQKRTGVIILLCVIIAVTIAIIISVHNDHTGKLFSNTEKLLFYIAGSGVIIMGLMLLLHEIGYINLDELMKTSGIESKTSIASVASDDDEDCYILIKREDIVGKYVGHTESKLMTILNKGLHKVVIIDEFYNLSGGSKDFGLQALGIINTYMSEHPDKIAFGFLGYKDKMINGPFRDQPGLKRRCLWHFEMDNPSPYDLYSIFNIKMDGEIDPKSQDKIRTMIEENYEQFKGLGGDMETLAFSAKLYQTKRVGNSDDYNVNDSDVREAIDHIVANNSVFTDSGSNSLADIIDQLL